MKADGIELPKRTSKELNLHDRGRPKDRPDYVKGTERMKRRSNAVPGLDESLLGAKDQRAVTSSPGGPGPQEMDHLGAPS